jgi:hypothetical protein
MATPAFGQPDSSPAQPAEQPASTSKPKWSLTKLVTGALATIAAVATLIANIRGIETFLQPSVTGPWLLTMNIQQSSYQPYVGHSATFTLSLISDGHLVTGSGEKIQVDGKDIPFGQHQPITVSGPISGTALTLDYKEKAGPDGAARETTGQLDLTIHRAGLLSRTAASLSGKFNGTAAESSGTITAVPHTP